MSGKNIFREIKKTIALTQVPSVDLDALTTVLTDQEKRIRKIERMLNSCSVSERQETNNRKKSAKKK